MTPHQQSQQWQGRTEQSSATQGGGTRDLRLQDVESPQQRDAVHGITRAIQVCEWCADRCVQNADPDMVECIRLCEDVSELGETAITLVPRRSRYASAHVGTLLQAVQACAAECGQHSHNHCQECARVLRATAQSLQAYLSETGGQEGGGQHVPTSGAR